MLSHREGSTKGGSGAKVGTMPQALTLNRHVPWDLSLSSLAFMDPSTEWGLGADLKVMNAEKAETQGKANAQRSQRKVVMFHSFHYCKWGY